MDAGAFPLRIGCVLFLLLLATGCGSDDSSAASDVVSSSPAPAPAPEPEPPVSCPDGAAVEPPIDEIAPPATAKTTTAQLNHIRRLMKQYPRSPWLRIEAAKRSLGPPPAGNPVLAQKLLEEALGLHERGCALTESLEWEARQSLGLALMLQAKNAEAAKVFQEVAARWPAVPQAHFDHACALCQLDRVDDCFAAFERALEAADSDERPRFVNRDLTPYHFVHQARSSRELAKLRADSRFEKAIAPHLKRR